MSSFLIVSLSLIFYSCESDPCVPANTCFEIKRHPNSQYSKSISFTCENQQVTEHKYDGLTCSGANTSSGTTEIYGGDLVQGGASGSIVSDYLQGVGCSKLTDPSEQCQDFMVLKHRGNTLNDPTPFGDIGDNCTAYEPDPSLFVHYSMVYMPVGCVNQFTGSKLYQCDENGWDYIKYEDKDCTGNILSAQSEHFIVDKCGYFSEWTHCNNGNSTGCVGDGVHYYWWYWYDLLCCPINGKTCCGAPSASPGPFNEGCVLTPRPTTAPFQPTTKSPTGAPFEPTPQPTTSQPTTVEPTTKGPTSDAGTAKPTSAKPTKQPTTPGTARPTAPTTGAPTDIFGTAKPTAPTAPTTKPPTSPGTARPTVITVGETPAPTDVDESSILFSIYAIVVGVVVVIYGY